VQFLPVREEHYPDYLGYAGWFYQGWNFPSCNSSGPTRDNFFPGNRASTPTGNLSSPSWTATLTFRFYEDRNLGVYTTKHFLEGSPFCLCTTTEDGDWQFHTGTNPQPEDGIVVCLEDITRRDPSVNQVYYLPYGGSAWRESPEDPWQVEAAD
jgi:hypothetical protein